mmetsp:Transcript_14829/g.34214  ORF Transcript_14829/g.34214 Transcript_14829/m.34214 type:complete len:337 (-) Transcript_14829:185-1195(-)
MSQDEAAVLLTEKLTSAGRFPENIVKLLKERCTFPRRHPKLGTIHVLEHTDSVHRKGLDPSPCTVGKRCGNRFDAVRSSSLGEGWRRYQDRVAKGHVAAERRDSRQEQLPIVLLNARKIYPEVDVLHSTVPSFALGKLNQCIADEFVLCPRIVVRVCVASPLVPCALAFLLGAPRPQPVVRDEDQFRVVWDFREEERDLVRAAWDALSPVLVRVPRERQELQHAHRRTVVDRSNQTALEHPHVLYVIQAEARQRRNLFRRCVDALSIRSCPLALRVPSSRLNVHPPFKRIPMPLVHLVLVLPRMRRACCGMEGLGCAVLSGRNCCESRCLRLPSRP